MMLAWLRPSLSTATRVLAEASAVTAAMLAAKPVRHGARGWGRAGVRGGEGGWGGWGM